MPISNLLNGTADPAHPGSLLRSLLLLAPLLLFGCNDAPDRVTAPAAAIPNGGGDVDVDKIAENLMTQGAVPARCAQVQYVALSGTKRYGSRGDCTCVISRVPRRVAVTAVIMNGSAGNSVTGKAYCRQNLGATLIAGPTTAVDPGNNLLGAAALVGAVSTTGGSACFLSSSGTSTRLVTCVWY
ncbi:MAG TPA: hypothetical protein VGJ36_07585 [Gemmatimonadales bacterium]|jgi:hypothetical protein